MLFCVSGVDRMSSALIKVYYSITWPRIRLIQCQCRCKYNKHYTLHVGSEYITLACCDKYMIYSMTHTGDLVNKTNCGPASYPHLCKTESDAVLEAACGQGHLYLRHKTGRSLVSITPERPVWPRDAVYVGGALFVLLEFGLNTDKIIKYVSIQ